MRYGRATQAKPKTKGIFIKIFFVCLLMCYVYNFTIRISSVSFLHNNNRIAKCTPFPLSAILSIQNNCMHRMRHNDFQNQ